MQVRVSGRHTELPEALRVQAIEKIGRLERYLDGMDRADVHFWEEANARVQDRQILEVTMDGHGHHVRCKVSAPDGFTAVDLAVEKLEAQLRHLKGRELTRTHARQRPELPPELVPETLLPGEAATG